MASRRQFLSGDFKGHCAPIRPPWALTEQAFIDCCTGCNDCVQACPEQLLKKGHGGYPLADFTNAYCTFCEACADSCSTGALGKDQARISAWKIKANIQSACITYQGVTCQSCQDACDEQAIRFGFSDFGIAKPQLHDDMCTGCGACIAICPVNAISMKTTEQKAAGAYE